MAKGRSTWRAPGRVNLIGDHTDYSAGLALPFAIPLTVRVKIALTEADQYELHGDGLAGRRVKIEELATTDDAWSSRLRAALSMTRDLHWWMGGMKVRVESDLPAGSGLSSSAAIVCATLAAVGEATENSASPRAIAQLAQRVENDYVGAPVGLLDPLTVMCAREGHALSIDFATGGVDYIPLPLAVPGKSPSSGSWSLLVVNTGQPHDTAADDYSQRVSQVHAAMKAANLSSFREPGAANAIQAIGDDLLRRRARHVLTENERVIAVRGHLLAADLQSVGELLTESHASLRDDFQVSTPRLDRGVAAALEAGAAGARLTGAGFGGCFITLTESRLAHQVEHQVLAAMNGADSSVRSWWVTAASGAKAVGPPGRD